MVHIEYQASVVSFRLGCSAHCLLHLSLFTAEWTPFRQGISLFLQVTPFTDGNREFRTTVFTYQHFFSLSETDTAVFWLEFAFNIRNSFAAGTALRPFRVLNGLRSVRIQGQRHRVGCFHAAVLEQVKILTHALVPLSNLQAVFLLRICAMLPESMKESILDVVRKMTPHIFPVSIRLTLCALITKVIRKFHTADILRDPAVACVGIGMFAGHQNLEQQHGKGKILIALRAEKRIELPALNFRGSVVNLPDRAGIVLNLITVRVDKENLLRRFHQNIGGVDVSD